MSNPIHAKKKREKTIKKKPCIRVNFDKKPDRQGKLVKRCQLLLKLGDKYFVVLEFFKDKHIICVNTSLSVVTRAHMGTFGPA